MSWLPVKYPNHQTSLICNAENLDTPEWETLSKLCSLFRNTGTRPTLICCSGSSCGMYPMRSSSWALAAPLPAWTRHLQRCTSTAATASGRWATRAGSATGESYCARVLKIMIPYQKVLWFGLVPLQILLISSIVFPVSCFCQNLMK